MKTVLLIRHAKSSWDDPSMSDFDRPLNERGKKDAPRMAARLHKLDIRIDSFITSPAKRARKTAEAFYEKLGAGKDNIISVPALYHADDNVFFDVIDDAPQKSDCIAIFSHNPGITDFANRLTTTRIDNMPTCSIFAVKAEIKSWNEFRQALKGFYFFDFPKSVHDD